MGFLDKAKAVAEQAATKAKEGVEDVQTKRELGQAYDELGKATFSLIESGDVSHPTLEPAAANPGVPDSHAAVDLGCDNHAKLTDTDDEFVWRHADAPKDNCEHQKMGPKGHQGSVVLVVTDGTWLCTAEYPGTNDGKGQPS